MSWLLWLSAAEVATMVTFATYTAAQPLLREQWGLSATQAGGIFAAQQVGYTVAVFFLSSLTDVVGVRTIYLLSATWNAAASLAFAFGASGFGSALLLRALVGVGLAGTYMPGMRLVAETFPTRRGTALGIYIACFSVGAALSLYVAGLLLPLGTRTMFALTGTVPLLAVLIGVVVVRDARPPAGARGGRPRLAAALRNAAAMRFVGAYAAHNWELFGMRAWLPSLLAAAWVSTGVPLSQAVRDAATAGSAVLLLGAFSNAAGGWLSDRWGRRRTIAVFLGASALCSSTIGWVLPAGPRVVIAVALLYGLLVTAESSTLSTAVAESADPAALGTTMAVQSSLGFVATIIAPALFGLVLDRAGWGWAFVSLGLAAVAGVGLVTKARA